MGEHEDLLSGPRGRRLCLSLITTAIPSMWTLVRNAVTHPSGGELFEELLSELAGIDAKTLLDTTDEAALLMAFEASVSAARYWQEPDDEDLLLEEARLRTALEPVAAAVLASHATLWWPSGVALEAQRFVQWLDETEYEPPELHGATAHLAQWKAATLTGEHRAAERPRDVAANWSGAWWSTPTLSRLVTTTRALPSLGAAKLTLVEDALGWERARLWALGPASACRIYEITGPEAWVELVAHYPLDVSLEKRHDWWRLTGHDGTWLIPDWEAVAADYDAVHLTALGYLTAAGRMLATAGSHTVLAGWNPDESYWLNDVLTETAPPVEWQRDDRHAGPWQVATP